MNCNDCLGCMSEADRVAAELEEREDGEAVGGEGEEDGEAE